MSASASKLWLAELCALSAVLPGAKDVTPNEARDKGKALHQYLCDVPALGYAAALERVPEAWRAEAAAIDLAAMPHSQPDAWGFEVAFAYDAVADVGRELHRGGSRDYSDLRPGETPGTADVVGVTADEVVVLDVKTGRAELEEPEAALQLLFLALAASRAYGKPSARVGWIVLRDGQPRFEWATIDALTLDAVVQARVAGVLAQVEATEAQWAANPDAVVPTFGGHCDYCPAQFRCPATSQLAREVTRAALAESTLPLEVPHEKRADFFRWVEAIGALHRRLEEHVEAMARKEPIPLLGGKVLGLVATSKEYLDGMVVEQVLAKEAPELVDLAVTRKVEASKDALTKAIRQAKTRPAGLTQQAWATRLLKAIRDAGGAYVRHSESVKVHKPKAEVAALPEAEGQPGEVA